MDKVPAWGFLVIGWLAGMGLKFVWEVLRLPGYGVKLFKIASNVAGHDTYFAADDTLLVLIGFAVIVIGRKDRETAMFGVGLLLGIITLKAMEMFDATPAGIITPASFAPFPPPP
jgi:hypothetical protein